MLAELDITAGHWTDAHARTGCTVLLFPEGTVASAEVRGGAPASRELEPLNPQRTINRIDAAVLTGGSAFGLATADGVMRYCEEQGLGAPTPAGPVPIVPALGLYDLGVGDAKVRPGAAEGYAACRCASPQPPTGLVGAGTGATLGHIDGSNHARAGGLRMIRRQAGELVVIAVVAVNAFGGIDTGGQRLGELAQSAVTAQGLGAKLLTNTVIGVVVSNARLDKIGCAITAQGAQDGLARAIAPPHTRVDGDAFIAAATGNVAADVDAVRLLAVDSVEQAIRSAGYERV